MARVGRHVRVTGRVQGVFFRQSAVDKARALSVTGWVRNCPDGSVEAHVEGEPNAVESMLNWLRRGPAGARVDELTAEQSEPKEFDRFEIRH